MSTTVRVGTMNEQATKQNKTYNQRRYATLPVYTVPGHHAWFINSGAGMLKVMIDTVVDVLCAAMWWDVAIALS
jgi:hypothetical protein